MFYCKFHVLLKSRSRFDTKAWEISQRNSQLRKLIATSHNRQQSNTHILIFLAFSLLTKFLYKKVSCPLAGNYNAVIMMCISFCLALMAVYVCAFTVYKFEKIRVKLQDRQASQGSSLHKLDKIRGI